MHIIQICCGKACSERFGLENFARAKKILGLEDGETSSDGRFRLEKVGCMGNCDLAPNVLMINRENSPLGAVLFEEKLEEKMLPPKLEQTLKQLKHDT